MNQKKNNSQRSRNKSCSLENLVADLETQIRKAVDRDRLTLSDLYQISPDGDIFHNCFPKKCTSCGEMFSSREEYLQRTSISESMDFGNVNKDRRHIIEYRVCACNNPLVLIGECRRDSSSFGIECRAYFNICIQKLVNDSGFNRDDAEELARIIFRSVLCQASEGIA